MTVLVRLTETVAARGGEDARLAPLRVVRAILDWPLPPETGEDTVRPDVVDAVSRALATCGRVAFRCDDDLVGADISLPPAPRSMADRLLDIAGLGGDTFGLAVASEPALVAALFSHGGWSHASQMVLVFDPTADPAPVLDALRGSLDWRDRGLPDGVRLLFGPGHDGDFAVVAATDRTWLERFAYALC